MKKVLTLMRVTYGKQRTPSKRKEYTGGFWGSPVGTKTEWRTYAKLKHVSLKFSERPKKMIFIHQEARR
jgi:hypothetical protein